MELRSVPRVPIAKPPEEPLAPPMVSYPSSRVALADLVKFAWAIERLRVRFPHLQDAQIVAWMRSFIDHNESIFLQTVGAIGAAQLVKDPMASCPHAVEKFVLAHREEHVPEAVSIYGDIARWADGHGCRELHVLNFSDIPKNMLVERFGRVSIHPVQFVRLGRKPGE